MIFGLFDRIMPPGSMKISADKTNYAFGETVKGTISLAVKKPIQATALKARIKCIERATSTGFSSKGARVSSSEKVAWEFETAVEGEKTYSNGEFSFEIAIPKDLENTAQRVEGAAGDALKAIQMFSGAGARARKWFIEGSLNIPGGRDISARVQINVV